MPERIQRKRTKGWKMPPNTVCVDRSSNFGNVFKVGDQVLSDFFDELTEIEKLMFPDRTIMDNEGAVFLFKKWQLPKLKNIEKLKGKNLACFCPLDKPCHADILLELANKIP